jgi:hypothetical protein
MLKVAGTLLGLAAVTMLGMVGWYLDGIADDIKLLRAEQRELSDSMILMQADVTLLKAAVEDVAGGNVFTNMNLHTDDRIERGSP